LSARAILILRLEPLAKLFGLSGGIPERSKGTDCKSVGSAFAGSNPAPATSSVGPVGIDVDVVDPPLAAVERREPERDPHDPDGLVGDQIPLASRIIAVADAYDAMTTSRTYRAALPRETAIAELRAKAGTPFDTTVVVATLKILNRLGADPDAGVWSTTAAPVSPPKRAYR
jgi:HD domain